MHKERAGLALGIPMEGMPPPRIRLAMRASEEIFIRQLKGSFIGQGGRGGGGDGRGGVEDGRAGRGSSSRAASLVEGGGEGQIIGQGENGSGRAS